MSKVIIAGSINMDIVVTTKQYPKVGETVFGTNLEYFPGGKGANQAVSSAKLGAQTILLGRVGKDSFGEQLISFLKEQKVNTQIFVEEKIPTGTAIITVAEETANNTIVVVPGANFSLTEKDVTNANFEKRDILVSQFEIPTETITAFFKKGREVGTTNIFNPAPAQIITDDLFNLIDVLILNETELGFISELPVSVSDEQSIYSAIKKIQKDNLSIVVTLGERGVLAFHKGEIIPVAGRKVEAIDTTGAGDCFVGAMALGVSENKSFFDCLHFANMAASIAVTKKGAGPSMPTLDEVNSLI